MTLENNQTSERQNTIYTVTANCQDCYRCVRACPVKAIRVSNGQAQIENNLCIKCGTCVRECPQKAKTIRSGLEDVKELIQSGKTVTASVAPSFAAAFSGEYAKRLPSALRMLGFKHVSETAEGAKYSTEKTLIAETGSICAACPTVVNYIEKYKPEFLDMMIPVASPMVAHGRILKKRYPGSEVVFIGPCAAKKQEAARPENADAIDAVLTFTELQQWLKEEDIDLANCSESGFESYGDISDARLFPVQGGMLKTGKVECDGLNADVIHVSGSAEVMNLLNINPRDWNYRLVEPLFCGGGCINGPGYSDDNNSFIRRARVIAYSEKSDILPDMPEKTEVEFASVYAQDDLTDGVVTENQINKVLERTGKMDPQAQLNCGACGYQTCIDNAIAVVKGMAEQEMCMPYMRRLAQQRSDRIIETSPNGIVVLDNELTIIKMNPAFHKMFKCNNGILGRRISYLLNAEGFEKILAGQVEQYESFKTNYGIRYHEKLYALRDEQQFIGIFSDISKVKYDSGQMDVIKSQTLMHAREFLDHQIRFAQEMAHYLGKSTAQSEEIAKRLINLYEESERSEGLK